MGVADLHRESRGDRDRADDASCSAASTKRPRWSTSTASSQFETSRATRASSPTCRCSKAAVETHDPATARADRAGVPEPARQRRICSPIADKPGADPRAAGHRSRRARRGVLRPRDHHQRRTAVAEREVFWPEQRGILLIKSVPIWIDQRQPDVLGTLILGASLDLRARPSRFKQLTNSEIAFGVNRRRFSVATLPERDVAARWRPARTARHAPARMTLERRGLPCAHATPLGPAGPSGTADRRSSCARRRERLRFLQPAARAARRSPAFVAVLAAASSATPSRARSRGRSKRSPRRCARWRRAAT